MKITKQKQFIAGISGIVVGLYMIMQLNDLRGTIPITLGVGILLWRFKNG